MNNYNNILEKATNSFHTNGNHLFSMIEKNKFIDFVLENSYEVFWILNENRETKFISPSIYELTGYTQNEFMQLKFYEKFSESSIKKLDNLFTFIDNVNEFKNITIEYISKKGLLIQTEVSGVILRDKFNNFKGLYGLTINVNDKYKLQNELNLEIDKNKDANKFKNIVLGIMGHEFRTPLSGILGSVKYLSKSITNHDDKEILDYIYQSATRLNATLNSVHTLAAIESNQIVIEKQEIDIVEIAKNTLVSFEHLIVSKNIKMECEFNLENPNINTDENCISQIIYHLMDNSVKFTDSGIIKLEINLIKTPDKKIEIVIKDSGIGINLQKIEVIFEPFRQLSEGHSRNYEGLGLGLTITKKLIHKLNGTIEVNSEINNGSEFRVQIPI